MTKYEYISLREKSEIKDLAAEWFHSKWGVPTEAYLECMDAYLCNETEYECFILGKHTARNGVAGISPPRREFQKC